jgi:uncharacterized protein (TIGR03435 family)
MKISMLFLVAWCGIAADDLPEFEAATIKPANLPIVVPGQPRGTYRVGLQMDASGLFRCSYCSLASMIEMAWNVKPYEIQAPDWAGSQSFTVEARMPAGTRADQALLMLRNLLTARFQMHLSTDERSVTAYSMVVTSGGSRLKPTDAPSTSISQGSFEIAAPAMKTGDLARWLSNRAGRPVIDGTGLEGSYEIKLTWGPDGPDGTALDNLFHALREQLGLELKSTKTNLKIYVVDKVLKTPMEN